MGNGWQGAEQSLGVDGAFAIEVRLAYEPTVNTT
jgi:hypothetical protein